MKSLEFISTTNVSIGYPLNPPLCSQLNFNLRQGEFMALLGRNGSGKTSLLLALAGLHQPLQGEIQLQGKNIFALKGRMRARKIALMLSPRNLAEHLRGRELVELGRWPHTSWHGSLSKMDHEKVSVAMELTGTHLFAEKPLGQLSDGERQKLCVARALAQEADVLLLDEPLSHLDAPSRIEVLRLLRHLAESQGKSILFSCHDLDLAFRHSHRILALLPKATWLVATPKEILADTASCNALGWDT